MLRDGYTHRMTNKLRAWMGRFDAHRRRASRLGSRMAAGERERIEETQRACAFALAKLVELRRARARFGKARREMDAIWTSIDDGVAAPPIVDRLPAAAAAEPDRCAEQKAKTRPPFGR